MTWKELTERIKKLTPEQQEMTVLIESEGGDISYLDGMSELLINDNKEPILKEPIWCII